MRNERIDQMLVALGLCESIDMARALIMAGRVYQGEIMVLKPSERALPGRPLRIKDPKQPFVSRGGLKLQRALEAFDIDVAGLVCMDVGASTGGFTDVLLQGGARRVYAIDVGYGQLHWRLRNDERVVVMERTNARFLTSEQFSEQPCFGATDVSFISLRAILPAALGCLSPKGRFVALIKPQFEAAAHLVGPKGVVRDPQVHRDVIFDVVNFLTGTDWVAHGLTYSPIAGPEGNIEFLLDIVPRDCGVCGVDEALIRRVVAQAYDNFVKSL